MTLGSEAKARLINKQLMREEAYREFIYDDVTGEEVKAPEGHNYTIGIGFNLSAGCPIDLAQIIATYFIDRNDRQLSKDLDFYEALDDVRKCVLLDMSFNMGIHGVEAFKDTINLISQGFYKNAAAQMRKSKWYSRLPHRAEPICQEMETGKWSAIAA